jgi:hypothetical protein
MMDFLLFLRVLQDFQQGILQAAVAVVMRLDQVFETEE